MNEKTRVLNRENIDDPEFLEGELYAISKILGHVMERSSQDYRSFLTDLRRERHPRPFKVGMDVVLNEVEQALPNQFPREE